MKLAIAQIVLGVLVIIAMVCPAPCSNIVLGAGVLGVGIAQFIRLKRV